MFVARGRTHGFDKDDWTAACRDLVAEGGAHPKRQPSNEGTASSVLHSLKAIERYAVSATDGDIGTLKDFLLHDERWVVRYLVVEPGGFMRGHPVLISPTSFEHADWSTHRLHLSLTRDRIKNGSDGDRVVGDLHLRSVREVLGYHIQGSDGAIGHVDDFIVDDETWEIRYLVVDTHNWWSGKKVLVSPRWASGVSWERGKVHLDVSRQVIKDSPEWDPAAGVPREYESRLHQHHGRPGYWSSDQRSVGVS